MAGNYGLWKKAKTKKQTAKTTAYSVWGYKICGKNIKVCPGGSLGGSVG